MERADKYIFSLVIFLFLLVLIGEFKNSTLSFGEIAAVGSMFAAVAAWLSYIVSQRNHQSMLDREQPIINVEAKCTFETELDKSFYKITLSISNHGGSWAKFKWIKIRQGDTWFFLTDKEQVRNLEKRLSDELKQSISVLFIPENQWKLGVNASVDIILVRTEDQIKRDELHSYFASLRNDLSFTDLHGRVWE